MSVGMNCLWLTVCLFRFRLRFNKYKVCNRRFLGGGARGIVQLDIFRYVDGEGHRGFLEDSRVTTIDRLNYNNCEKQSRKKDEVLAKILRQHRKSSGLQRIR